MAFITAGIALVSAALASVTVASVASFAVRTLVTIGISKLVSNRANKKAAGAQDVGSRFSLAPATNNKLPVSYGSAFLGTVMTDAKITTDQKTMYYVYSLCEATSGTMSFGKIFWNGKEVTLGAGDYSANNKVVSLTTNATPPQVDDTINGYAWIYKFSSGSSSGTNTGGTSAITILSDAGIPVADRWTSTDVMTDTCFIIVKVVYNKDVQDAQRDPKISVQVTNTLTKPGAVLLDYMTDVQYGCAINVTDIDTASLTALDVYSDQTITYIPVGGGTTTQPRYRIDGPIQTGDNCLSNLQQLADACDSWLQYSELTGKWTIVMNKPYTGVLGDLYSVDSSVLIGGIDINPIDLNQTYNSMEVQYPNANINDQTDYKVVDLTTVGTAWYDPSLLSPNEPDNRLVIQYPQINNYIRAVYLGVRRLLQSREDLTIVCNLDYSGIQVVAGDVVRVTLAEYGWADKLFRVSQVQETKTSDGFLGARITAFEYNGTIYADNALLNFIPEANTGLTDPNIISIPTTPVIANVALANSAVNSFNVSSNVPATGTVLYMDFNVGTTSNVASHKSYSTVQLGNGAPYTANTTVSINVADLSANTYYWSTTARNDLAGRQSNSSNSFTWGGLKVSTFDPSSNTGGITTSNIQNSAVTTALIANSAITTVLIANGAITADKLAPGLISTPIFVENFSITDGTSLVLPVDITTVSPGYNDPVYYNNGSAVSPTLYYPYFQGTSSTTDGYYVNSTAPWQPASAAMRLGTNGSFKWYSIVQSPTLPSFGAGATLVVDCAVGLVANVDCQVQIQNYLQFDPPVPIGTFAANDTAISTYSLKQNQPLQTFVSTTTYGTGGTVLNVGLWIRVLTASANVTVQDCRFVGSFAP